MSDGQDKLSAIEIAFQALWDEMTPEIRERTKVRMFPMRPSVAQCFSILGDAEIEELKVGASIADLDYIKRGRISNVMSFYAGQKPR